jgi:hypothetical protein
MSRASPRMRKFARCFIAYETHSLLPHILHYGCERNVLS